MIGSDEQLLARRALPADRELVTTIVARAFAGDPLWSWALRAVDRGAETRREFWQLMVDGALRYPWSSITTGGEAVAVWIPPGEVELAKDQEQHMRTLVREHLGENAADVEELLARFEAAHPHAEPYFALSLLATDPDHRGHRIGMRLLALDLERIDAQHQPAYLESTNPANLARYRSVGFEPVGEFSYPGGGPVVTTMWRPAR